MASAPAHMMSGPAHMMSAVSLFRCAKGVDITGRRVRDHEVVVAVSIEPHAQLRQPGRFFYDALQESPPLAIAGIGCNRSYNGQHTFRIITSASMGENMQC